MDEKAIELGRAHLAQYGDRSIIHKGNFRNLASIVDALDYTPMQGIVYDFGLSMDLIKNSGRGFSFQQNEPLDMRFDVDQEISASDIVNSWPEHLLADTIYQLSDERYSRHIAHDIVKAREKERIMTTGRLVEIIEKAVPPAYQRRRTHPATKTFQALRMAVNDELHTIEESLKSAMDLLEPGGRIVVISFHSLEDRLVKNLFRDAGREKRVKVLTKKPLVPTDEEMEANPASRSAKLRAIEIL